MRPPLPPARILVVDDDPGMMRAVSRVLGRHHEVLAVLSPGEALARVLAFDPDIAVLDIMMPEMNGFELMQALRERRPDLDCILMTGSVTEPEANLVRAIDEGAFYFIEKPFDPRVLRTLVGRCLELLRLRRENQRQMRRLQDELEEARRFQVSLLPETARFDRLAINARYLACTELAGDLYDYARASRGRVAVFVADVSGHGASAAMMTGIVKSAFHAGGKEPFEPLAIVHRVAESISAFDPGRFVTLICARFAADGSSLEYVNAGHPAGLVHAPGRAPRELASTGPLISSGIIGAEWEQETVALEGDERILLYSDGLIEARGGPGMYGRERLLEHLCGNGARGAALLDGLIGAVAEFTERRPYVDDVTLLTVDFARPAAPRKTRAKAPGAAGAGGA